MNFYSMFLVRFAYALQARFDRVHTFLFSTNVVEISDLLRTRNLPEALRRLSQRAAGWSSGTKIGESLQQFNQLYGRKLLSRDTVFIILSDGWDTGEPEVLAAQLRATRRRRKKGPVAESAAGTEGLSAHHAGYGCGAAPRRCLCSGA